jgi:5-methyltetrahydrofolate--homocysteine methyltransferase
LHAAKLEALLASRILLLDGAMGTMIQRARLAEEDYRGARFRDWPRELRGHNDLLSITQPRLIREPRTLDHRAHRAVEQQDAAGEQRF